VCWRAAFASDCGICMYRQVFASFHCSVCCVHAIAITTLQTQCAAEVSAAILCSHSAAVTTPYRHPVGSAQQCAAAWAICQLVSSQALTYWSWPYTLLPSTSFLFPACPLREDAEWRATHAAVAGTADQELQPPLERQVRTAWSIHPCTGLKVLSGPNGVYHAEPLALSSWMLMLFACLGVAPTPQAAP
jgi:hypothetical protein